MSKVMTPRIPQIQFSKRENTEMDCIFSSIYVSYKQNFHKLKCFYIHEAKN